MRKQAAVSTHESPPVPGSVSTQLTGSRKNADALQTSSTKGDEGHQYLGPRALTLLGGSLLLVILLITVDASILATAIPQITDHFHTIANIGWYPAAYMITNASLQPLTGKVFTYFPLKGAFLVFVAVFELGSLICAVASSSTMLVVGRAVAGIGASGLMNGVLTILAVAASPSVRPTMMGLLISFAGAGQLIGPLVGGALTEHASWRWCFWINLPIGAVAIVATTFIRFPAYKARKPSWALWDVVHDFDITGFVLFALACIMLLLALEWGGTTYSWSSATIIGLLCRSSGTFIVFIIWDSLINAALQFGGILVHVYYLPLWFQAIKSASPTMSAVYILPTFGLQIFSAIFAGALTSRFGYLMPLSATGSIFITISAGLASTLTTDADAGKYIGYQVLNGVGRGLSMQQPVQAVQSIVLPAMIPIATATVAFSQTFGAALFISLSQTTFLNLLRPALRTHAPNINAQDVINTGATNYLAKLSVGPDNADTRTGVLLAYNQAVTRTFYLAVGCGVGAFVTSLGLGKTKVETKKEKKNNDAEKRIEKEEKDERRSGLEESERSKKETGPHDDSVNGSPQPSRMAS
ncbi:uncharacterized protein A1O5_13220 [Cladophialophora psammophila CBS 110553]|uniref:Major facilitator superfamily (MFS) profile domain-containing protein n=1 Tax=Cladophialophora psammophila CBS 110553 TaxID=1182543 RepID=W9W4P1_9EURO|nr:uncharacterized protein A1O5_13220 [Cladophialophora psammophila CBS 110553]EXJ53549.1 hypothetical protein A1O5_13220 [Cladophialophora psammophila CBS 110553]